MDVEEALEAQIRNIEEKYGKSLAEWMDIIAKSGKTKHGEILALLKNDYGVSHGSANRLALKARGADSVSIAHAADAAGVDPVAQLYQDKKAALKPVHDAVMAAVHQFGGDVEVVPKNGYVSVRRKKQFAMLQPTTATRLDVGLILKGVEPTDRLEASGSFNAMFTHRVRLTGVGDVDPQLVAWLKTAYESAL